MWPTVLAMLCTVHMFTQKCSGIDFIEIQTEKIRGIPDNKDDLSSSETMEISEDAKRDIVNNRKSINDKPSGDNGKNDKEEIDDTDQYFDEGTFKISRRDYNVENQEKETSAYPPIRNEPTITVVHGGRRYWLVTAPEAHATMQLISSAKPNLDDKDANLKHKIAVLVDQTMHDTELKVNSVQRAKQRHRNKPPYRIGFILSLVKKSRDVLNELFNVAVKHRDEWKALEQLKIFELIVHTNVDTTNLVRQLVEIHIQNLNATKTKLRSFDENRHQVLM